MSMNSAPLHHVTDDRVEAFWPEGAICLCGLFDRDWIEGMRSAVEDALAHPGKIAANSRPDSAEAWRPARLRRLSALDGLVGALT